MTLVVKMTILDNLWSSKLIRIGLIQVDMLASCGKLVDHQVVFSMS